MAIETAFERERDARKRRGAIIRQRRRTLGWTAEDLAKRAGVRPAYVEPLEEGIISLPHAMEAIVNAIFEEQLRRISFTSQTIQPL